MTIEQLIDGHEVSDARRERLTIAIAAGATDEALIALRDAERTSMTDTITLSSHRYEHLSRGRGWCRQGRGADVRWGERTDGGDYRVGPGRWSVGATDGFDRKAAVDWRVTHVQVGGQTWTVAS